MKPAYFCCGLSPFAGSLQVQILSPQPVESLALREAFLIRPVGRPEFSRKRYGLTSE